MLESFREFDAYGLIDENNKNSNFFVSIPTSKSDQINKSTSDSTLSTLEIDPNNVCESIMKQCEDIGQRLNVHPSIAFMLLETQNWNKHTLFDNFNQISTTLFASIGVPPNRALEDPSLRSLETDEIMTCDICFDDFPAKEMLYIPFCGHAFCHSCWVNQIQTSISEGQSHINCLETGCISRLPYTSVESICGKELYSNIMSYLNDTQINLSDTLTCCPNKRCNKAINLLKIQPGNIMKCSCNYEFCAECHKKSHSPSLCSERNKWAALTNDDIMQKRILGPNCKICPNCKNFIEKNGGCNHMTCKNCHHEFCWMCLKDWKTHPQDFYHCAAYKEDNDPYLKPVDNVNSDLLQQYHDPFKRYKYQAKALNDQMEKYIQFITQSIRNQDHSSYSKNIACILLDQLFWAIKNLQWSQPHLFFMRFAQVKDLPIPEQVKGPETTEIKIFMLSYKLLEEAVNSIQEKIINSYQQKTNIVLTITDIEKMIQKLKVFRTSLIKQTDYHYHTDIKMQ